MTREQLWAIIKFSNLDELQTNRILDAHIYPSKSGWNAFIRIALLTLGAGFFTAGVIFFFAYNWDYLSKFTKLGVMEFLVFAFAVVYFIKSLHPLLRNVSLTVSAILVGGMFSVFGQIYQTQSIAFDLMLNWSLAVTLWVLVARFAPLTALWLILLQITLSLYLEQVAHSYNELLLFFLISISNLLVLVVPHFAFRLRMAVFAPQWLSMTALSACMVFLTLGMERGINEPSNPWFIPHAILTFLVLVSSARQGFNMRMLTPLVMTAISSIVILSFLIVKLNDDEPGLLFLTVFILTSVVVLAKYLIHLNRKWQDEA